MLRSEGLDGSGKNLEVELHQACTYVQVAPPVATASPYCNDLAAEVPIALPTNGQHCSSLPPYSCTCGNMLLSWTATTIKFSWSRQKRF